MAKELLRACRIAHSYMLWVYYYPKALRAFVEAMSKA
jgi:hypothetical protein